MRKVKMRRSESGSRLLGWQLQRRCKRVWSPSEGCGKNTLDHTLQAGGTVEEVLSNGGRNVRCFHFAGVLDLLINKVLRETNVLGVIGK